MRLANAMAALIGVKPTSETISIAETEMLCSRLQVLVPSAALPMWRPSQAGGRSTPAVGALAEHLGTARTPQSTRAKTLCLIEFQL